MSSPRYERYKDSGVSWLGKIPDHWEVAPARRVFEQRRDAALPDDEQLSATQRFGVIPQRLFMETQDQKVVLALSGTGNFKHVQKNDFVISLRSFQGGIERSSYEGCVSPAYTVLRATRSVVPDFWTYALKCSSYVAALQTVTEGIRDGKNISYDQFGGLEVPIPPTGEQEQIALFLDRETAKIDALIAEQEKLLALLAEKRQATISHAVTRGLDPNVPMKESGIPWLGEVPAHWEIGVFKRWFSTASGGTPDTSRREEFYAEEGGYPWIRTTDLGNERLVGYEIAITEAALRSTACAMLPVGCVLVAMYGGDGSIGKNALTTFETCINQAVCALLPNDEFDSSFSWRYVQFFRPYWMIGAESSRKDPNISQDLIRSAPVVCPPLEEQQAIALFLDDELKKMDGLIVEAEHANALLKERRSALIAAAVTGQINVRATYASASPQQQQEHSPCPSFA